MKASEVKRRLLQNPEVRREYEKDYLAREIARMVIKARIRKGITQEALADLVGTKQPSIARLERGECLPSLTFLQRVADAFRTRLLPPQLEFLVEQPLVNQNPTHSIKFLIVHIGQPQHNYRGVRGLSIDAEGSSSPVLQLSLGS